jgi:hypothetical protein
MTVVRSVVLAVLLLAVSVGPAIAGTATPLPGSLAADCGSGTRGIGFTAYGCVSGGAGTTYAHPAELLVHKTSGALVAYRDTISEPNLMARSPAGEVVAAHNDSIVQLTASALGTLVSQRALDRLDPGSPGLASIEALAVNRAGAVTFRANYYAPHRNGCANVRAERTPDGQVKVLERSAAAAICG